MSEITSTTWHVSGSGYLGGYMEETCNRPKCKRIAVAGMLLMAVMSACAEDSPGEAMDEVMDGPIGGVGGTGSDVPISKVQPFWQGEPRHRRWTRLSLWPKGFPVPLGCIYSLHTPASITSDYARRGSAYSDLGL